ncbi:MAG: DUF5799 family protein [Haloferacaceae archaeon]
MGNWNDLVVGDRMTVDQEFSQRVQNSRFSSQEWGLIMTATSFEIEAPETDRARIVANTENLKEIMPELENIRNQMPGGQAPGAGGGSGGGGSGGFLGGLKDALGLGGGDGVDEQRLEAARKLTQEYAEELQQHLEQRGKWERVQEIAARDEEEASD